MGFGGRPTKYSKEKADEICEWLVSGNSLHSFCRNEGNPTLSTIFRWIEQYPEFSERYARARAIQSEVLFDMIQDKVMDEMISSRRARVIMDAFVIIAERQNPEKYSPRQRIDSHQEISVLAPEWIGKPKQKQK